MTRETLVFYSQFDPIEPWREAVESVLPDVSVKASDEIGPDEDVRYALVWKPPLGFSMPTRTFGS